MRLVRPERLAAAATMEALCQRCGEARGRRDQSYCLACGAGLPEVDGTLPRLRRAWVMRLGWYPGDRALIPIVTLLAAVAGAVAVVVVMDRADAGDSTTVVARTITGLARAAPAAVGGTQGTALARWPAGRSSWTIILGSYPASGGADTATAVAEKAVKKGLAGAGLLASSGFPSLQPGYVVVFDGAYSTLSDATAALGSVRSAGFAGAYTARVER
jgi:ribosomal protein L37E